MFGDRKAWLRGPACSSARATWSQLVLSAPFADRCLSPRQSYLCPCNAPTAGTEALRGLPAAPHEPSCRLSLLALLSELLLPCLPR